MSVIVCKAGFCMLVGLHEIKFKYLSLQQVHKQKYIDIGNKRIITHLLEVM